MPFSSRDKQQRSYAIEHESGKHTSAVAETLDDASGGNGHQKISTIHHSLYEGRFGFCDIHVILKMLVEHIENAMGKSPKEEKRCDENEGNQIIPSVMCFHQIQLSVCHKWQFCIVLCFAKLPFHG